MPACRSNVAMLNAAAQGSKLLLAYLLSRLRTVGGCFDDVTLAAFVHLDIKILYLPARRHAAARLFRYFAAVYGAMLNFR